MGVPSGYRPQLDGLRAIAVVSVAIFHWFHPSVAGVALPLDFLGVGLFFVLSGYLITGILLGTRTRALALGASLWSALRAFVIRRMLRLFPALLIYLTVIALLDLHGDLPGSLYYLTYLGNFRIAALGQWPVGVRHLWSLAVEEQFYLVAPFIFFWVPLRHLRTFLWLVVGLAIAHLAIGYTFGGVPPASFLGLVVGCLVAVEAFRADDPKQSRLLSFLSLWWPAVALFYAGFVVLQSRYDIPRLDPVIYFGGYLAMAGVVWRAAVGLPGMVGRSLDNPVANATGRVSYGLYLWHLPAPAIAAKVLPSVEGFSTVGNLFVYSVTTAVLASLSWFMVERPCNRLKDRFPYVRAESAPPSVDEADLPLADASR